MADTLCPGFRVTGNTTFRCSLPNGHAQTAHYGFGAMANTYAHGAAPGISWRDSDPGAMGVFRRPDDSTGKTPFDGHQIIPGDGTLQ